MVDSVLDGVCNARAGWAAELGIEPDCGGESQQALGDPDAPAWELAGAVALERELPLSVQKTDSIHWRMGP